jgi:hypothetical protein
MVIRLRVGVVVTSLLTFNVRLYSELGCEVTNTHPHEKTREVSGTGAHHAHPALIFKVAMSSYHMGACGELWVYLVEELSNCSFENLHRNRTIDACDTKQGVDDLLFHHVSLLHAHGTATLTQGL